MSEPLYTCATAGAKLIGSTQESPLGSVAEEAPALTSGQADATPLFNKKPAEIAGLVPPLTAGRVSGALPTFSTTTVCGLSVLVSPGAVRAKFRIGGSEKSSFKTRLSSVSAT